jgi:segregation and condensation protein B
MEREQLWSIIESLLFATDRPLAIKDFRALIDGIETRDLREVIEALAERYIQERRGFVLCEVAGGWQFRTNPDNAEWVRKMLASKPVRLSRAALETLAVIAYRQPVTRAEIEDVRGVDSGGVLKLLLDRRLIKIIGKKEEIGRPSLYGTTKDFLEFFGLKDLTNLPTLREFHELTEESVSKLQDAGFADDAAEPSPTKATNEERPARDAAESNDLSAANSATPAADSTAAAHDSHTDDAASERRADVAAS